MKAKFTPGPWARTEMGGQATSPRDGYFVSAVDDLGVRTDIAHVRNCPTVNLDELKANAALIAAAPDLYDALRALRSQYASVLRIAYGRDVERDGNPYIAEVDAALAKAGGDQ